MPDHPVAVLHPLRPVDHRALAFLSAYFADHGFTDAEVPGLLGAADAADLLANSILNAAASAPDVGELIDSPAGVLAQLFVRNGEVPAAHYNEMLDHRCRRAFDVLGLVGVNGDSARARVSISLYSSMYFLSDQLFRSFVPDDSIEITGMPDVVMPPHASSLLTLDNIARRGGRLLDAGSGSGFLALLLSAEYDEAVGIDINGRASCYARYNIILNNCAASFRTTNFFVPDPALGVFDHIVFNSPARAPHRSRSLETGEMRGPRIVRDAAGVLPAMLAPGGVAQIFLIAEVPRDCADVMDLAQSWLPADAGPVRLADAREIGGSRLSVSAKAIENKRVEPGCLLVDDREDAEQLIRFLVRRNVSRVSPMLVSLAAC